MNVDEAADDDDEVEDTSDSEDEVAAELVLGCDASRSGV